MGLQHPGAVGCGFRAGKQGGDLAGLRRLFQRSEYRTQTSTHLKNIVHMSAYYMDTDTEKDMDVDMDMTMDASQHPLT